MINVVLPNNRYRRLPFFLAMEEWVACNLPPDEYFFTWQVRPTVIIGRNQDLQTEVDMDYCQSHGIEVVRRRSGGGCVYADLDNIMISYVCPETDVEKTFVRYIETLSNQLRKSGIEAEPSGRNDITVHGRKISGNAFYLLPDRSIVHGTMLFDTDLAHMSAAITPSKAKLDSHGVKSVESRITTISKLRPNLSLNEFHKALIQGLETGRHYLSNEEVEEIEKIEQKYYKTDWIEHGR